VALARAVRPGDQHPVLIAQLLDDIGADVVADPVHVQSARRSSRCIPSGHTSPACSASVHPFFRSRPATSPHSYSRTRARGSARPNREPAIRSCTRSSSAATSSTTMHPMIPHRISQVPLRY